MLRFKLEAVRLAQQPDVSVAAVARDLDLHDHVLRRWIKQYEEDPANAFPSGGQMKPQDAEIAALKKEIKKLRAQRDMLKKATVSSTGQCNTSLSFSAGARKLRVFRGL